MKCIRKLSVAGSLAGLSLLLGAWASIEGPPHTWLGDDLIGMKVVSSTGEKLGKIEDIVVHPGGEVSYAVLSFGGWFGMGDKLFAMPWTILKAGVPDKAKKDSENTLVLSLDKERLKDAPGFDKDHWPAMANPDWAKDIDAFYAGDTASKANPNTKRPVEAAARTSVITWRVSELKGTNVQTPSGDTLGDIAHLAIDVNGRVSYAVLSVGGFLGMGDTLVAVPWSELQFSLEGDKGDKRKITLASSKNQLKQAPVFKEDKDDRAAMSDPIWINQLYAYYSCEPYWKDVVGRTDELPRKKGASN